VRRTERAPAKLNFGLRVVGRRPDGYHTLESVFVPFDLADELALEVAGGRPASVSIRVEGGGAELADPDHNLAARAARRLLDEAGVRARVAIRLRKCIPVGAGLGGGSSDAGAVLRALAALFPDALPAARLARLALSLGADVPFFLAPRPARVSGIGEVVEPLPGVPSFAVLVVVPEPPLSTAEVFRAFDEGGADGGRAGGGGTCGGGALTRAEGGRSMLALPGALDDARGWAALLANDLEPVAARLRPAIVRVRGELERGGARAVGMSGSGPSVFGLFADAAGAGAAAEGGRWEPSDRIHVGRTAGSP
jgi:4-diphosphocytidyl-2-C-methyl-D-erythritol kinase